MESDDEESLEEVESDDEDEDNVGQVISFRNDQVSIDDDDGDDMAVSSILCVFASCCTLNPLVCV